MRELPRGRGAVLREGICRHIDDAKELGADEAVISIDSDAMAR
jgi:hypothetical protein